MLLLPLLLALALKLGSVLVEPNGIGVLMVSLNVTADASEEVDEASEELEPREGERRSPP